MEDKLKTKGSGFQMFASFNLGDTELALSATGLQEVVHYPDSVTKVPLAPPFLTGVFNLRGTVIPIIDVAHLLQIEKNPQSTARKVAIVFVDKVRVGLLFDATSEILNVHQKDIAIFDDEAKGKSAIVRSVLKLDGGNRLIDVIDPASLVKIQNLTEILTQSRNVIEEVAKKKSKRSQCITFKSGAMTLGMHISAIREIIRVPEIKRSVYTLDYSLGIVNLRGAIIPILNFQKFLKLESASDKITDNNRIVILKLPKAQVGFLVDSVDSIVSFYDEEVMPIPMFQQDRLEMMKGMLPPLTGSENVILLDESKILTANELMEITRGHSSLYGTSEEVNHAAKAKAFDRKPYISFKLDSLLSTKLGAIDEIAKIEEELMKPPGYPEYVAGMMKMRGDVVTVIDLRQFYGMKSVPTSVDSRLLIVKGRQGKFGLLVDSVESIDTVDENNKTTIPAIFAKDTVKTMQGHMKEIVQMTDHLGQNKTFMILDVLELIGSLEGQAA
jgi:purine-binding chemotaxis protein CheW